MGADHGRDAQNPQQMNNMRAGNWQLGVGKTIHGRTLGLYGYGRIAKIVEGYAKAFGMNVIWWGSEDGRARAAADGKTIADSREAFFATPDVVSVHVRLKPATKGMITATDLGHMRQDAVFCKHITRRIDRRWRIVTCAKCGPSGMAALDVFDREPITWDDDPIANHPNVICTPHIGFVTEDEFELQFADIFDQVAAFANGAPIHMINPQVWQA